MSDIALVQLGDKYGYVDSKGNILLPAKYNNIEWIDSTFARVNIGGKISYAYQTESF